VTKEPEPERELEDMQERADKLEEEIEGVREDWERKKSDPSIPGATGAQEDEDT
jgi:hypothetical protein